MKKIFLCVMCAAALTACNNGANKKDQAFAEEYSKAAASGVETKFIKCRCSADKVELI